jgi:ferredoxin
VLGVPTRQVRIVVQGAIFALWVGLIASTHHPMDGWLARQVPVSLILRIDPLVMTVVMGGIRMGVTILMLGIATFVIALLLGRVFCGWVCPLGTTFDAYGWVLKRLRVRFEGPSPPWFRFKFYLLLAILIFAGIGGVSPLMGFDPIVIITRTAAVVIGPAFRKSDGLTWEVGAPPGTHGYLFDAATLFLFLGIMAGTTRLSRIWCRTTCPLGAYLAVLSRHAVLRRDTSGCVHCNICSRHCPTGAISFENAEIYNESECIKCFTCSQECPVDANFFTLKNPIPAVTHSQFPVQLERRQLLATSALALISAPALNLAAGSTTSYKKLMRPPMSREEHDFLASCIRCAECMKACPTGLLKPAGLEHGIRALWSPVMIATEGYCMEGCNACSQACPTDAIMKYPIEKKYEFKAGTAVFNTSNCISYTEGKYCSECVRVCPTDAIAIHKGWEPTQDGEAPAPASVDSQDGEATTQPEDFVGPIKPKRKAVAVAAAVGEKQEYDPSIPARKQIAQSAADVPAPEGMTPTRPIKVVYDKCVGCGACEFACNQIVYGETAMVLTSAGRAVATSFENKSE